jgi:two-component system chemotaxis response regulator CheB
MSPASAAAPDRDLVVIGASAGGLRPLGAIVEALPPTLPAALVVVVHTRATDSLLPDILRRRTPLRVERAADGAVAQYGTIHVAPPDRHVLIGRGGRLRVVRGPREHGFRPAIDPLFRSAARARGARVVGVVLSGALDDGRLGLGAIVRAGGAAIVQDLDEAEVPSMPRAALAETAVDCVLPAAEIAPAIVRFCGARAEADGSGAPRDEPEPQRPADDPQVSDKEERHGPPTPITCPACGASLWETGSGGRPHDVCHVGHRYGPESLAAEHGEMVEEALCSAVRILEQHAELRQRMARSAAEAGLRVVADSFAEDGRAYHEQAQEIRRLVFGAPREPDADRPAAGRRARAR